MNPLLRIKQLKVELGGATVVDGIDLELAPGEILIVVGPSGCGKTTLLRTIAGLELPSVGSIELDGTALNGAGRAVAPHLRQVGMVFQGLALFPHLTIAKNIGFGLKELSRQERELRVAEELKSVGLDGMGGRYPHQLSGGQQQRAAIARSLVLRPRILLMDEPFSDLDGHTRAQVRTEVLRILRDHGTSAIIVSHDREDAVHLGDRIAMMDKGRFLRIDDARVFRQEWTERPTLI